MQQWLKEVARGKKGSKNLSYEEAKGAARLIGTKEATDAQIAAFFVALRLIEETPEEKLAFVHEFRRLSQTIGSVAGDGPSVDVVGPYDGRKTFAATIPVSLILAANGVTTYMHGGDSLPPKYGTPLKQLLSALNVPIGTEPEPIQQSLQQHNIAFADTEALSPPLQRLRPIREQIGVRSFINTVEKMLHLAVCNTFIMGVFHKRAIDKIIPMLKDLPYKETFIVQGIEGSEDMPIYRKSNFIYKVTDQGTEEMTVYPGDYGLHYAKEAFAQYPPVETHTRWIQEIIENNRSNEVEPYRAQVIFNAGVRMFLLGLTSSVGEGIQQAETTLEEKAALEQLQRWKNKIQAG